MTADAPLSADDIKCLLDTLAASEAKAEELRELVLLLWSTIAQQFEGLESPWLDGMREQVQVLAQEGVLDAR